MKLIKIKNSLRFVFFFYSTMIFCQLENRIFISDLKIQGDDSSKLFLRINTLNFLRNTEYYNPIESGKTLFGYQLNPYLTFHPYSFARIDFGCFLRKDYGNDKFKIVVPVFSFKLSRQGYSVIFGNYEGAMNHRLIEPVFNVEYAITKPVESGFQFKIDKKRVWSDTWIDWQKMIYVASPFKEEIMAGNSSSFKLNDTSANFRSELLFQTVVRHAGGQIDGLRNTPSVTYMNAALGGRIVYQFAEPGFVNRLFFDAYFVHYSKSRDHLSIPFQQGKGVYLNAYLKTNRLSVMCSYWNGENFVALDGTPIFQSVNLTTLTALAITIPKRELLFLRLLYEKNLAKDLKIDLRFEPFYDIKAKKIDYSYSVYLRYHFGVQLKLKRKK